MTAPNIVNVAQLIGRTVTAIVSTSTADILENTAASNKVFKINSIYAANVDGSADFDLTLNFVNASPSQTVSFVSTVRVPADATVVITDKDSLIYLEEGDKITGTCTGTNKIHLLISYEEIS